MDTLHITTPDNAHKNEHTNIPPDMTAKADCMKGEIAMSIMSNEPFIAYSTTGQLNICPICTDEPISAIPSGNCGHAICWNCMKRMNGTCPYCKEEKNYIRLRGVEAISIDSAKHVERLETKVKELTNKIGDLAKMDNMIETLATLQSEINTKEHELADVAEKIGMANRINDLQKDISAMENRLGQAASMEYLERQVSGLVERNNSEQKRLEDIQAKLNDIGTMDMLFNEMQKLTKTIEERDESLELLRNKLNMITGIIEGSHIAVTPDKIPPSPTVNTIDDSNTNAEHAADKNSGSVENANDVISDEDQAAILRALTGQNDSDGETNDTGSNSDSDSE